MILGCGHWARLSGRARVAPIVEHVRRQGPGQLVLGSEAGDGSADILALPRVAEHLTRAGLPAGVVRRVALENALDFLRIDRACLAEERVRAVGTRG
jgi:predicted metal-dependent TIM-barrel fold hydrolase